MVLSQAESSRAEPVDLKLNGPTDGPRENMLISAHEGLIGTTRGQF